MDKKIKETPSGESVSKDDIFTEIILPQTLREIKEADIDKSDFWTKMHDSEHYL